MSLNPETIKAIQIKYLDLKMDSDFHKGFFEFCNKYDVPVSEETHNAIIKTKKYILSERRKLMRQFPFLKEFNKKKK